jgi:hypothetical protein
LKEDKEQMQVNIKDLNYELEAKGKLTVDLVVLDQWLEQITNQMEDIKQRLSKFEQDDTDQELQTLQQLIREKVSYYLWHIT